MARHLKAMRACPRPSPDLAPLALALALAFPGASAFAVGSGAAPPRLVVVRAARTERTRTLVMSSIPGRKIDEQKYEAERLAKDAEAMQQMQRVMERATDPEADGTETLRNPWKWAIRKRVWDFMEANDIARNPRPVHHRIPNFEGAELAAANLCALPEFKAASVVKVNPDTPQKEVRFGVLTSGKKLMAPQPRLRTGFFSTLTLKEIPDGMLREATTSIGMAKLAAPLDLEDKIKVDLIVVGSTAVCPKTGARIGKGEGFAELEYGMLRWMGAISEKTLVVTSVNDCQIVDDIPSGELMKHDVSVDIICTPTRVIRVEKPVPKPTGIYWDLLSPEKLSQVRVLQKLKRIIEAETGEKLPTGPSEKLPPLAERNGPNARGRGRGRGGRGRGGGARGGGGAGAPVARSRSFDGAGEKRGARGESAGRGRGSGREGTDGPDGSAVSTPG